MLAKAVGDGSRFLLGKSRTGLAEGSAGFGGSQQNRFLVEAAFVLGGDFVETLQGRVIGPNEEGEDFGPFLQDFARLGLPLAGVVSDGEALGEPGCGSVGEELGPFFFGDRIRCAGSIAATKVEPVLGYLVPAFGSSGRRCIQVGAGCSCKNSHSRHQHKNT